MTRYRFELFVAARYLRAHRGASVISVITPSRARRGGGVMALVIAIAVTTASATRWSATCWARWRTSTYPRS